MEGIETSATEKVTHARVSQACQRCRSLKTRCLPSERTGTCQRCFNAKRDCVWAETPRRPRRVRGPSRISQVEQKIDGLVASLVNSENPQNTAVPTQESDLHANERTSTLDPPRAERPLAPGSWLLFPTSFVTHEESPESNSETTPQDAEPTHQYLESLRAIHNFGDDQDVSQPPRAVFHGSHRNEPAIENETVQNLLSSGEANDLLDEYRSMSTSFPFVPIAPCSSAHDLHSTQPMLFLAIITVASWKDHKQQMLLDKVYRTELANRTIIQPRRTLSILQSILVYLSRYHFVFSHKTQQIFFLQQIAVGLALDLGLHQNLVRPPIDFPGRPPPQPPSPHEQLARQRTFLGCYYMSSMVASGLIKPNLLKFTNYMTDCGRRLNDAREYASDAIIPHLIALRRLDDQIHDSFFTEETRELALTDPRILMNFRFTQTQLDAWRREARAENEESQRLFDLSSSFTEMQLNSIVLRPATVSAQQDCADPTVFNALLATLEACKRFFDTLLAFPMSEYHLISFSEWMRIPFVVIILARLCIPSEAHAATQWDVKTAYERARLDLYLESLCYRMKGLSTFKRTQYAHPDFYWAMEMIMNLTKSWFVRKMKPRNTALGQTSYGQPTPGSNLSASEGGSSTASSGNGVDIYSQATLDSANKDADGGSSRDLFAFMRDAEFDMDKFFDMGLWGDESYVGMGFGGGMRF